MPFTYPAPTGATTNSGTTAREQLTSETIAFDNTAVQGLSPPADANLAEFFAWAPIVASLDTAVAPDLALQQGYYTEGGELESSDEISNIRFIGTQAASANLVVTYFKVATPGNI